MNKNQLLHERISKLFLFFVIPTLFAEVIAGIQGMIDGVFLGNVVDANAMSCVNMAAPFMQIILGGTMVVCTGTLSYLGRTLGENDLEKTHHIFKSSLTGLTMIALFLALIGFLFAEQIALLLGANDILLEGTKQYIQITALFAPMISFMLLFGFVDRLLGMPQLYLYANLACLVTNIVADYITVKLLHFGIRGAAFSTGLAFSVGMIIVMQPLLSRESSINFYEGKFHSRFFLASAYNGCSEGITYLSSALALFLFNRAFISFAGESGVAAFTIINYLGNFVSLIMFSISDGISSIVSCNFGAQLMDRVRKTFYTAIGLNFILGIIIFGILTCFSESLIRIFIQNEPEILSIAVTGAKLYGLSFLFSGFNIVQSGYHTAVGNAGISFIISACKGIIFITIGIILLPAYFDIHGVWLTLPFAELMTALICLFIAPFHKELYFNL